MLDFVSLVLLVAPPTSARESEHLAEETPICECPSPSESSPSESSPSEASPPESSPSESSPSGAQPPCPGSSEPSPQPWSRLQLAPVVLASTVLGIGPPARADRFAALGAGTGLHFRLPRGAFFGAELRAIGRGGVSGTSLVRLRTAVGAGYWLRYRSLSLGTSLWATVEPWWLRGGPVDSLPHPLLGLVARMSPALYEDRIGDRDLVLMFGPVLELAASASFGGDGAQAILVSVEQEGQILDRMRVGGFELSTGLMVRMWFDLPKTR